MWQAMNITVGIQTVIRFRNITGKPLGLSVAGSGT